MRPSDPEPARTLGALAEDQDPEEKLHEPCPYWLALRPPLVRECARNTTTVVRTDDWSVARVWCSWCGRNANPTEERAPVE